MPHLSSSFFYLFSLLENVQTNLIENINAPDHSIPASSAIQNCLKNDANITDINGENIFE